LIIFSTLPGSVVTALDFSVDTDSPLCGPRLEKYASNRTKNQ
jgi:hypothetical protein